ncbi:OTU domain-containing protein 5-like [Scyliorhinus canicula]|uniref:OTU domain-containing protein 5-like n=1 Tax=Scyliorhinus canicula TaxID=7830 RepID=UPI0018F6030C|nr:OTU domain-containing protein 5-like [Scyliorhinus canicula]
MTILPKPQAERGDEADGRPGPGSRPRASPTPPPPLPVAAGPCCSSSSSSSSCSTSSSSSSSSCPGGVAGGSALPLALPPAGPMQAGSQAPAPASHWLQHQGGRRGALAAAGGSRGRGLLLLPPPPKRRHRASPHRSGRRSHRHHHRHQAPPPPPPPPLGLHHVLQYHRHHHRLLAPGAPGHPRPPVPPSSSSSSAPPQSGATGSGLGNPAAGAGGLGGAGCGGGGGGGGINLPTPGSPGASQEEGAGYNSEDEYETAAREQLQDPAKVEQEHWFEKALSEKKGFVIKKMKEDGACLFRAVGEFTRVRVVHCITLQSRCVFRPRKASATCSSATAAATSGLEEWSGRSPRQRSLAASPEHPDLHPEGVVKSSAPGSAVAHVQGKPPSPCAPGTSNQMIGERALTPAVSFRPALDCRAIMQQMSPTAFGLADWEDDEILASVLAVSQQEYLDSMKMGRDSYREPSPDKS